MKPKRNTQEKEKIKRKKYDSTNLRKALEAVAGGMSQKLAAKTYQVPRTTLLYRIKNPHHNSRPGPSTILTEEEENKLEAWINTCCKKGFPKRKDDVINSIAHFLKKQDRGNRFKNGEKWFKLFLKRHPNISIRTPESVTAASATVSESDIKGWFHQIENYLQENNLFDILSNPSRVYNGDETNFLLCPKTGVVLAPKGSKNVYEMDSAPAKTSLTVMFTFGADGSITPPMVIFPNKRLSADITSKVPPDWGIGLSDNGWMKAEVFHDYIESVLYPYLVKKGIQFPIIFFVDGHKTHLTYAVSELCTNLEIVLIALYPNCTRILQPADVAAFKPLKYGWQKSVLEWRRTNPSEALTKSNFVPLLQKTIEKWVKPSTVINGFKATGLCPWNANQIDYSKCLGKVTAQKEKSKEDIARQEKVLTREKFISIVGENKIMEIEKDTLVSEYQSCLKRIWDFFEDKDSILSIDNCEALKENKQRKDTHFITKEFEQNLTVHDTTTENNLSLHDDDITQFQNITDMRVIIADTHFPDTSLSHCTSVSNEVVVDFVESNDYNYIPQDELEDIHSQDVQPKSVTHIAEVYSQNNDKNKVALTSMKITVEKLPFQHDYDKIEWVEDEPNLNTRTPSISLPPLTPIKLQDVLCLPKTPQRKGKRDTKRAPFVLTSADWKKQENEKKRIKDEKEENIKKRKEERDMKRQQKLEETKKKKAKPKQKIRKTMTTDPKRAITTLNSPNYKIESKENIEEAVDTEKELLGEDLNIGKTRKNDKAYTTEEIERFLLEFED